MHRARSLAAQCLRDLARSRCRFSVGGAGAVDRLVRCNDTARSCLRSDTRRCLHSNTVTAESAGVGGLQGDKNEEEQNLESVERHDSQPADPDSPDDVITLVGRLNNLKSLDNPYAAEEGLRLLEAGRARGIIDLRAYNAVFRLLSVENKKSETITRLAKQMEEDGVAPDLDTYNFMIYGYGTSKDASGAQRTYEELRVSELEEDETTLSNMVVAHSWGDTKNMTRFFDVLSKNNLRPSRAAYHSMIAGLRREQNWAGIREILEEMEKEGLAPTEPGYAVGFLAARRLGDPEFSKTLLARRSQAGMPPRQDFFVNVMVTLGEANKPEEVLEYWRQLVCLQGMSGVDIKPETYFLTLRSASKVKAWDEVECIIGMMQDNGKQMDERVHNALIGRREDMSDPRDVERVISMLAQMERNSRPLSPRSKLQLAGVCAHARMYDTAMPLIEAARNSGMHFNKSYRRMLLQTLSAMGNYEEIRDEWKQSTYMHKKEYTGSVFSLFMGAAQRVKDPDMALELHTQALKGKKNTTKWFHPTAVQILAEAGRLEEALGVAETLRTGGSNDLPKLPPASYNILCRCCKKRGDKERVVKLVQAMRKGKSSTYLPPPDAIGFVVEAFTENGKAKEVIALFDRMRAQNIQPDPEVYVLLADAAVAADDRPKAALFVELVEKKGGGRPSAKAVAFARGTDIARLRSISSGSTGSGSPSPMESMESTTT